MDKVDIEQHGNLALLRLQNGVTNAINPPMLADLERAMGEIRRDCRGVVLAGGDKFFSIGFDLPLLMQFEREEFGRFWLDFNRIFMDLYRLPVPTACAIGGHAVAGGAALSLATDFRVAATGRKQIGLNEIKLGLPVPWSSDLVLRQLCGDRAANRIIYYGDFASTSDVVACGWIDEVVEEGNVEQRALELLQPIADNPGSGFEIDKENRTGELSRLYESLRQEKDRQFLDTWFSEEAQSLLTQAAESF